MHGSPPLCCLGSLEGGGGRFVSSNASIWDAAHPNRDVSSQEGIGPELVILIGPAY